MNRLRTSASLGGLAFEPVSDLRDPPEGWPIWQVPARYLAIVHPGLREFLASDLKLLGWLRLPAFAPIVIVIGVAIVPSLLRALEFLPYSGIDTLNVYTESLAFMALAVIIGLIAPTLGVLLVGVFALADLGATIIAGQLDPIVGSIAGRLVSYWLLWLLVVEVPIAARLGGRSIGLRFPRGMGRRAAELASGALAAGVLVWIWSQSVPLLIRPVFVWAGSEPTNVAIAPMQEQGGLLSAIGAIAALVAGLVALRAHSEVGPPLFPEDSEGARSGPGAVVGRLVAAALTVAALGGVVTGLVDVAILFGALVAARPVSAWFRHRTPLAHWLAEIPWVVRFVAAFAASYGVGFVIIAPLYDAFIVSEFLQLVVAIAVGVVIFEFLLSDEPDAQASPQRTRVSPGAVVSLFFLVGTAYLAFPRIVAADNCSSKKDCNIAAYNAAAGAAAAAGGAALSKGKKKGPPSDKGALAKARQATGAISKTPGTPALLPKWLAGWLVNWQLDTAGQIMKGLGDDPPRDDFRIVAEADPHPLPELVAVPGIPPEEHAALVRLAEAMRFVIAHGNAAIISFDRYGGARRAREREWIARQAIAVVRHKKAMAPALNEAAEAIEAYLATNPTGLDVTADDVRAYQDQLRREGFSDEDVAAAHATGLGEAQIAEALQARISADPVASAGDRRPAFVGLAAAYRAVAEAFDELTVPPEPRVQTAA